MAHNWHAEAQAIHHALEKFMTDDQVLIDIISKLDARNLKHIRQAYEKDLGRNLVEDVKKNTHGKFEDACISFLTPPIALDAAYLHKALHSFSLDEDTVVEIICTRSPREVRELAEEYKYQFEHDLSEDITAKIHSETAKLLLARLGGDEEAKGDFHHDTKLLYDAGQGRLIGKDETVFLNVLAHRTPEYIAQLNTVYAETHGKSLEKIVEHELSGHFKKGLLAIVTPAPVYFADVLHNATKAVLSIGTDGEHVIRVIATQRDRHLKEIANAYLQKYDESLKDRLHKECSGDYKKLVCAVVENIVHVY